MKTDDLRVNGPAGGPALSGPGAGAGGQGGHDGPGGNDGRLGKGGHGSSGARRSAGLDGARWRQVAAITVGALALYVGVRALPTGTNLNHVDFRVDGKGAIEMCDPANPQFIPVVAMRSPVAMTLRADAPLAAGQPVTITTSLKTASGKPIEPVDLVVAHTRKLHLLVVDPTLRDYQHVHPEPSTQSKGDWTFSFTPRLAGTYRVFADFTPAATGRGLYASADVAVAGDVAVNPVVKSWEAEVNGYRFTLTPPAGPVRAGQSVDLAFEVTRSAGGPVPMEPVMGAFAHLVAFDQDRGGFAHLHPNETDLGQAPDAVKPRLTFKITIPRAGLYVIWSQVNLGGREVFAPFWFDVAE